MKILHDLIFQAGGYSFDDLKKASSTERRQILQLGCAVLFSTFASIINWTFASVHLLGDTLTGVMIAYPIFITALVVFPISLSINRNLIFYSDTHENKQITYTYSSEKEATHTLPYVRFALVAIVCGINFSLINANAAQLSLIALLGIFELYPLMLKKQMGQTILGRRMQARLQFQHKRGILKREQYAKLLEQIEREMNAQTDPNNNPDPSPEPQADALVPEDGNDAEANYNKVRLVQ